MPCRLAVIDSGTNTFVLYIYDLFEDGSHHRLHRSRFFVELAEEGAATIGQKAYARALSAYSNFAQEMLEWKVDRYRAIGTAALRNASNGQELVQQIFQEYNIQIELIDGDREAQLIYQGVRMASPLGPDPALLMDIGGGSVEFILADEQHMIWAQSFRIGISYLYSQFPTTDPILPEEVKQIEDYLDQALTPLFEQTASYQPYTLIGSSGTMDSIYSLYKGHGLKQPFDYIPIPAFQRIYEQVKTAILPERLSWNPIPPTRAKLIVVATILLEVVLRRSKVKEIVLSDYALREGVLWEELQRL
jgi:exopolyphosphatase/guanosine-5'-triphosphate,3'-diphosphate pyrophosphatase